MSHTVSTARGIGTRSLRNILRIPSAALPAILMPVFQVVSFTGTYRGVTDVPSFPTDRSANWFLPLAVVVAAVQYALFRIGTFEALADRVGESNPAVAILAFTLGLVFTFIGLTLVQAAVAHVMREIDAGRPGSALDAYRQAFTHLRALGSEQNIERLNEITERLMLIDWFDRLEIPKELLVGERVIRIRHRYLAEGAMFDQRSANEGFLLLLFYFTLFISPDTPAFFAIDNIDVSLNPKLCMALLASLVELGKKHDKQVIVTTHNPAVLDGLNLHDDEQRLFVVSRNKDGYTKIRRVGPPKPLNGDLPVRLSEAFLRGYIGGLPKNF